MCRLLDTGAQVSTMTESFYRNHMADFGDLVDITDMLRISAANGGDIPYLGYIECNLKALGYTFENKGFLVVKDPSEDTLKQRKRRVPGVIGSNIFKSMKVLCDNIEILPKNWGNILALYEEIYENDYIGKIRIPNHYSIIIPAGSVQIIEAQTKPAPMGEKLDCIVEENTGLTLPNGFALASTLVSVTDTGRIPVQICNYSNIDINLRPRTLIGSAANMTTPSFQIAEMNTQTACSVDINGNDILTKMEVGLLTEEQEQQVRNLIIKYKDTFSKSEDDIGFCDKIEHHIPTSDNIPVRIPHRRIPPNQWSEVREYLQNALKMDALSRKPKHTPETARLEETMILKSPSSLLPSDLTCAIQNQIAAVWEEQIGTSPLSCLPIIASTIPTVQPEEMSKLQKSDPHIKRLLLYWKGEEKVTRRQLSRESKEVRRLVNNIKTLKEKDGIIYRETKDNRQLLLPSTLKQRVLKSVHDDMGHQGFERTFSLLKTRYYWPYMTTDIVDYCDTCERCKVGKLGRKEAFELATEETEQKALERQQKLNVKADNKDLPIGCRIFLRNHPKGRAKIQDAWNDKPYRIIDKKDSMYKVEPLIGRGESKYVHRREILDARYLVRNRNPNFDDRPQPCGRVVNERSEIVDRQDSDDEDFVILLHHPSVTTNDENGPEETLARRIEVEHVPEIIDDRIDEKVGEPLDIESPLPESIEKEDEENSEASDSQQNDDVLSSDTDDCKSENQIEQNISVPDPTIEEDDDDDDPPLRRSQRSTAGKQSNPLNLPRSVSQNETVQSVKPNIDPSVLAYIAHRKDSHVKVERIILHNRSGCIFEPEQLYHTLGESCSLDSTPKLECEEMLETIYEKGFTGRKRIQKKIRQNPEVQLKEKQHKREVRLNPEVQLKQKQHKREVLLNPEVLQKEKTAQKGSSRQPNNPTERKTAQKGSSRKHRSTTERKTIQKESSRKPRSPTERKQHKRVVRLNPEVLQKENQHKREVRLNPEVLQKEKQHKREVRETPEVLQKEKQYKREVRVNPEVFQKEKQHKREVRLNPGVLQKEKQHKREVRLNPGVLQKEKQHKREVRLNPGVLQKENQQKKINLKANNIEELITNFHKIVTEGPLYICTCCKQLLYKKAVTETSKAKIKKGDNSAALARMIDKCVTGIKSVDGKEWICKTCYSHLKKSKMPPSAAANGMEFPQGITRNLNPLEFTFLSPLLPFMKIHKAPVGKQLKIQGNMVVVPSDTVNTVQSLPRLSNNTSTIKAQLKRRLRHRHCVYSSNIRPEMVREGAKFLSQTGTLYKSLNIKYNLNWTESFDASTEENQNTKMNGKKKNDENVTGSTDTLLATPHFFETNERDLVYSFAPAENNQPISIFTEKTDEEQAYPGIFCGQARIPNDQRTVPVSYGEIVKSELRKMDRRCARLNVENIFFKTKKLQMKYLIDQTNMALRKFKTDGQHLTAKDVKQQNVHNLIHLDQGYKVLKTLRGSPPYFQAISKELFAMIRTLGPATFFLTLSAAETQWIRLLRILAKLVDEKDYSDEELQNLTWSEKKSSYTI
ncbi:unnamed protein product [Mytilus coruscus]|uniref:Integrase zinc-binding domain-containing protein n=1 Tax=Mytilus coruscus TaxID=42192 RepID=A0A6J8EFK7_MYTCO|nr:unnamed protein product [Mytilus coruscus]